MMVVGAQIEIVASAKELRLVGADGNYELLGGDYEIHVGGGPPSHTKAGEAGTVGEGTAPLRHMLRIF